MTAKQEEQIQTAIRLPKSILARLDKHAEYLSQGGLHVTRAEVLRIAATRGINILETEQDLRTKGLVTRTSKRR